MAELKPSDVFKVLTWFFSLSFLTALATLSILQHAIGPGGLAVSDVAV